MGFFDYFKKRDINSGVRAFRNEKNAYLLDVRTEDEYAQGFIPGSINLPLQRIAEAENLMNDKTKKVFVYCLSGARAQRAVGMLRVMGYENVENIGGISAYREEEV